MNYFFGGLFMFFILGVLTIGGLNACTDSTKAAWGALGNPGHIVCWDGNGGVVLDTISTGKITTVEHSDGWEFKDSADGKFVRVTGTCVIRN